MNEQSAGLLQAVRREPVVRHVHRELRRAILEGRIASGDRLVETHLADTLQVSRTPIREAIQKLEAEGLVRRLHHGGVVVEDTRAQQFEGLMLRQMVESASVRLACRMATEEEAAALLDHARDGRERSRSIGSVERGRLDREFHLMLARASHSARTVKLVEEFYELTRDHLWQSIDPEADQDALRELLVQHVDIAEAVAARDELRGEAAVRAHLTDVQKMLKARLLRRAELA